MDISGVGLSAVKWDVFTSAFRKIRGQNLDSPALNRLVWDLKDAQGSLVGDGIYYLRVETDGVNGKTIVIKKVLLLR